MKGSNNGKEKPTEKHNPSLVTEAKSRQKMVPIEVKLGAHHRIGREIIRALSSMIVKVTSLTASKVVVPLF